MTDSQKLDVILSKIDNVENEMKEVKVELKEIKTDLEGVKVELKEVKTDLEGVKVELKEVKTDLEGVKVELREVKTDLGETKTSLGNEIRNLKFVLENEIRVNIQRIAEGHLDVSRNIHEVLKKKDELELVSISTRLLESEVRELKRKIS